MLDLSPPAACHVGHSGHDRHHTRDGHDGHRPPQQDHTAETIDQLRQELAEARDKIANLERALTSSRRIGAAMGVLMYRHKITIDQAFELLRVASQVTHRKLRDVAEDVLTSGELTLPHGLHKTNP
jgi:hypothetical protein